MIRIQVLIETTKTRSMMECTKAKIERKARMTGENITVRSVVAIIEDSIYMPIMFATATS